MHDAPRVLVVDDDAAIRDLIVAALTGEGYGALAAPTARDALQLAADSPPDLILLDLTMPIMDGRAFAQAYRRAPGTKAPIIALTALQGVDAAAAAEQMGASGFLTKPFDLQALLSLIDHHTRPVGAAPG
jgi:CheY-like chemotaxis protein